MKLTLARMTVALALATSAATPVMAQPASAALARELTSTLAARHLDAFAVRDPQVPDGFVAALAYPDVQLLVVSARYPAPAALQQQLDAGQFRDVYVALQSNPIADSKLFVQDMQADGLRADNDQTADIVYEKVVNQTVLQGDVKSREYRRTLSSKDDAYSRALQVLLDALKAAPESAVLNSAR
jgi:hypothetical protein